MLQACNFTSPTLDTSILRSHRHTDPSRFTPHLLLLHCIGTGSNTSSSHLPFYRRRRCRLLGYYLPEAGHRLSLRESTNGARAINYSGFHLSANQRREEFFDSSEIKLSLLLVYLLRLGEEKNGVRASGHRSTWFGEDNLLQWKVAVINLDPANDTLPYECAVNIEDLIKLSDVMTEHSLGPNGGLVYCMDYLEKNIDWLESKLKPLIKDHYLLFDFPGQVELFFLHGNVKTVIMKLIKKLNLRLTAVHLVDSHLCSDASKYVSGLLLSLSTMLHLELPHINVFSKIDLIENYGKLAFNLDFYTDVQDLSYLQCCLDEDPRSAKYRKLTNALCEVIEDFSLVNFTTLDIQDKESVGKLVRLIDKSNGYIFASIEASAVEFSKLAVRDVDWDYYRVAEVQEKYIKDDDNFDYDDK